MTTLGRGLPVFIITFPAPGDGQLRFKYTMFFITLLTTFSTK
jgi:hypothetical protein